MLEQLKKIKSELKSDFLQLLFFLIVVFGTKGYLLLGIPLVGYLIKNKTTNLYNIFKVGIFYKIILLLVYPYGNMKNEVFRVLLLIFLYEFVYKKNQTIIFCRKQILVNSFGILYFMSLIWNFFSDGRIESMKLYSTEYKILLLLPLLFYCYKDNSEVWESLKKLLPLFVVVIFFKLLKLKFNIHDINMIKGGIISGFSLILPYTFFTIFAEKKIVIKIINVIITILGFITILKSDARGALFSIVLGIALGVIIKFKIKGIFISFIGVLSLSIFIKSTPKLSARFTETKDFSTRSRYYLVKAGLYTFEKNLIFGSGYNNTQKYFINYSEKEFKPEKFLLNSGEINTIKNNYLRNFPDTHNIVVDHMAEFGIFGILISLFLWILIPIKILISYFKTKKNIFLGIFTSIISYLAAGMSWSIWSKHSLGVLYYIVLVTLYLVEERKVD
ncbi:MAG: O-antigen ligase family protein [Cetobacterium sp.]